MLAAASSLSATSSSAAAALTSPAMEEHVETAAALLSCATGSSSNKEPSAVPSEATGSGSSNKQSNQNRNNQSISNSPSITTSSPQQPMPSTSVLLEQEVGRRRAAMAGTPYSITKQFPWRLHEMLDLVEREGLEEIVSFLPDGRSFKVHDPSRFEHGLMKRCFNQTRYKSFQRQLNLWGFERHNDPVFKIKGTYSHPWFIRGRKDLTPLIVRVGAAGNRFKTSDNTAALSAIPKEVLADASQQEPMQVDDDDDLDVDCDDVHTKNSSSKNKNNAGAVVVPKPKTTTSAATAAAAALSQSGPSNLSGVALEWIEKRRAMQNQVLGGKKDVTVPTAKNQDTNKAQMTNQLAANHHRMLHGRPPATNAMPQTKKLNGSPAANGLFGMTSSNNSILQKNSHLASSSTLAAFMETFQNRPSAALGSFTTSSAAASASPNADPSREQLSSVIAALQRAESIGAGGIRGQDRPQQPRAASAAFSSSSSRSNLSSMMAGAGPVPPAPSASSNDIATELLLQRLKHHQQQQRSLSRASLVEEAMRVAYGTGGANVASGNTNGMTQQLLSMENLLAARLGRGSAAPPPAAVSIVEAKRRNKKVASSSSQQDLMQYQQEQQQKQEQQQQQQHPYSSAMEAVIREMNLRGIENGGTRTGATISSGNTTATSRMFPSLGGGMDSLESLAAAEAAARQSLYRDQLRLEEDLQAVMRERIRLEAAALLEEHRARSRGV
mmetsp:Transcript_16169/g.26280  ORF Transcript_16169/g.26280 Transcript_16169/m.26280 type:complete len:724 (+) Transcript_16169:413-2584(+)